MRKYKFYGKNKGSIGISYWITAEAENELALYDNYEHIMHLMDITIDDDYTDQRMNEAENHGMSDRYY